MSTEPKKKYCGETKEYRCRRDEERKEKVYKLVGVKGDLKADNDGNNLLPSREAAGAPDGFRKAIHCRTPTKRWMHSWSWAVTLSLFSGIVTTRILTKKMLSSGPLFPSGFII